MNLIKPIYLKLATAIILVSLAMIGLHFHNHKESPEIPSALVQTTTVKLRPMAKTLITYGVINVAAEHIQQLTIQNEAVVQQIFVTAGQHVNKGDPLLQLSATATSGLNLKNAKITADFTKKELDRLEKLRSQFLATNADIQLAKENFVKAENALSNLNEQKQNETGKVLQSICNCNIIAINVQPGQVVSAATTLLTYADTNQVQIRLGVEYEELSNIKVQQKVIITPIYNSKQSYTGFISNITNQIDPKTGLIDVIVPLGNITGLIPGSMVRGEIFLESEKKILAVPRSAVLYDNKKPYVFIVINNKAVQRWITIGEDNGEFIGIKSGVKENEAVVTVGNYELKDGMSLRVEHLP